MKVLLKWVAANADAVIALIIAVAAAIGGLGGVVSNTLINSAVLATLAALSLSLLRDHWHRESNDPPVKELLSNLSQTVTGARQAVEESSMIRVLIGSEISEALEEARKKTSQWIFKGGTATFLRAVTLPECIASARQDRRSLSFQIEILDPTDTDLCARYAQHFKMVVDGPNEDEKTWTARGTQLELYATILASCWWQRYYPLLRINIALSRTMTTFRWDLTPRSLVITERGPRFPAMLIHNGRFYYDYWRSELDISFNQARQIDMERARRAILSDTPSVNEVVDLFAAIDVHLPSDHTVDEVREIIDKAINATNPYGS